MRMLSARFVFCPYCAHPLPDPIRPGDHRQCVLCDICLTCEERSSKGFSKCHVTPAPRSTKPKTDETETETDLASD